MENKPSRKLYPKTVLTLYLKLYCNRRDIGSKNKMMDGIQSWLSLNKTEKQYFYKKYRECQIQYKNKLANLLKKTQPFMKKKKNVNRFNEDCKKTHDKCKSIDTPKETNRSTTFSQNDTGHNIDTENDMYSLSEHENISTPCEPEITSQNEKIEIESRCESRQDSLNIEQCMELAEPTAPSIRTGKELFEMLNTNNEHNSNAWKSLSSTEKRRYQRATTLLKNDYLTKHRAYLESLPSKKLFDYYNDFFN